MPDLLKVLENFRMLFLTVLLGLSVYYFVVLANMKMGDRLPFKPTKKRIGYIAAVIFLLIVLYKILSAGGFIFDVLFIIFISIIMAYILNPLVSKIQNGFKKKKIKRVFAIAIVYLSIIIMIAILFLTVGPKIVQEVNTFIQKLPNYVSEIYNLSQEFYQKNLESINKLANTLGIDSPEQTISNSFDVLKEYLTAGAVSLGNGLVNFFGRVFNLVLVPITTFYMLNDKDKFKDFAIKLIPWKRRDEVMCLFREVDDVIGSFIRGQLVVCVFIGIATAIALTIIGIDFSIIIGIFAGIFNIIPYLGPIIGLVPAVLLALIEDPIKIIWVIVAITAIQQFETNFVSPKIVGDSVGIHPLAVMFGVMIGGSYFGIMGMLLAVPTIATSRILYRFVREKLKKLPDEEIFSK